MKLIKLILMLFALSLAITPANAQVIETVQIGFDTQLTEIFPIFNWWMNTYQGNQFLYSKEELGLESGDKIVSISYYCAQNHGYGGNFNIRLKETTLEQFGELSNPYNGSELPVTTDDEIYASVSLGGYSGGEWITFNLDKPYIYQGNNLIIDLRNSELGSRAGWCYFYFTAKENSGYYWTNANNEGISGFDPSDEWFCVHLCNDRPNTLVSYVKGEGGSNPVSEFTVDGILYKVNDDGASVTVTYEKDYYENYDPSYPNLSGAIIIPENVTYDGITYSVTAIGDHAFAGCADLTSVTIPSSVTSIGSLVFDGCGGLTSLIVDEKNTKYDSRYNCNAIIETLSNTLICGSNNTTIPSSVTAIGADAFRALAMKSVTIPNSVLSIGNSAFAWCGQLESVVIGNSVKSIGSSAFWDYGALSSLTISNSVTSIGSSAFSFCNNLKSLTLTGQGAWNPKSGMPSYSRFSTVNIESEITSLGDFGFSPNVVNCYAVAPPACSSSTFARYDGELHVPINSLSDYTMADYWQNFSNMINDIPPEHSITLNTDNLILGASQTFRVYPSCVPNDPVELVATSSNPNVAMAIVVNRSNSPAEGLISFPNKDMALAHVEQLANCGEVKTSAIVDEKAIMIVGISSGTATITVTTADGKSMPAVLEVRVVDVNGDFACTASDVTALYNYILFGNDTYVVNGDVNGDGAITASDVTAVYNILLRSEEP